MGPIVTVLLGFEVFAFSADRGECFAPIQYLVSVISEKVSFLRSETESFTYDFSELVQDQEPIFCMNLAVSMT